MPQWKCESGEFIELKTICDGYKNCIDGSDEGDELCTGGQAFTFFLILIAVACYLIVGSTVMAGVTKYADKNGDDAQRKEQFQEGGEEVSQTVISLIELARRDLQGDTW